MSSKHLGSPTRLTEFAPLTPEVKRTGGFFSKLFRRSPDNPEECTDSEPAEVKSSDELSSIGQDDTNSEYDDNVSQSSGSSPQSHRRTLSNVLNRLSNILDTRGQTPQVYKDSDFKQYWMPDRHCKECYECGDRFNTFRRRHHCRICGQIFCSRCCNQEVPGKIMGYTGFLRVCTYCCKVVLSYAQTQDVSGDLDAFGEDLRQQLAAASDTEHSPGASSGAIFTKWTPVAKRKGQRTRLCTIFDGEAQAGRSIPDPAVNTQATNLPFDVTPINDLETMHERQCLMKDSQQLREICQSLFSPDEGLELQSHRHRLRTYTNCLVGTEIVDWLVKTNRSISREQAVTVGQSLMDLGWLECISANQQIFTDLYALYRPNPSALDSDIPEDSVSQSSKPGQDDTEDDSAPLWFKAIECLLESDEEGNDCLSELNKIPSTVSVPENLDASSKSVFYVDTPSENTDTLKPSKRFRCISATSLMEKAIKESAVEFRPSDFGVSKGTSPSEDAQRVELETSGGWQGNEVLREDNGDRIAYDRLKSSYKDHMLSLLRQLLRRDNLSSKWADTIMTVTRRIAGQVRPDVRHEGDDMDIRQYVTIKKIPGGLRSNTNIISGVVCSKIVAHKRMRHNIVNPKVLLLRSPIEYQRVENKFSSLEPQILQEHEFLRNCVGRIAALEPDILLVERTVSRLAQEFLLEAGITLVLNVKPSVMDRVARFTQADIITSVDGLVGKTTLGFCYSFKTQTFLLPDGSQKSLLYFDGCASHLGCTVTLRGGTLKELIKVKKIMHFMTYVAYNCKLEVAFLMDEFALPPPCPGENPHDLVSPVDAKTSPVENTVKTSTESFDLKPSTDDKSAPKSSEVLPRNCGSAINAVDIESKQATEVQDSGSPSHLTLTSMDENTKRSVSPSRVRSSPRITEAPVTEILDQSDPLQNYQNSKDESIFVSENSVPLVEIKHTGEHFKRALNDTILSISPYMKYEIPYLETEVGSQCPLRKFFTKDIYWSEQFQSETVVSKKRDTKDILEGNSAEENPQKSFVTKYHPFVTAKLTAPLADPSTQALLADFRARGGHIQLLSGKRNGCMRPTIEREASPFAYPKVDCLDPTRHQRMAVLFSSFSVSSINYPNPCVSPWVVTMDFYGRNDITLGGFLERYCFRESYACPSKSCDSPMTEHIRRFIHESSSIQVILKKLERPMPAYQNSILMWEWCRKCKEVTPVVPMSLECWSMSFAKYLDMRFHGTAYGKRSSSSQCPHTLHQEHFQYFGFKDIVASFKFSTITLKEICLPPMKIGIYRQELSLQHWQSQAQLLSYKGNQAFSAVTEQLLRCQTQAQTECQAGTVIDYINQLQGEKQRLTKALEDLKQVLASVEELTMEGSDGRDDADPVAFDSVLHKDWEALAFKTMDQIVRAKRIIAEAVVKWNSRIMEFTQQQKKYEKEKSRNNASSKKDSAAMETTRSSTASLAGKEEPFEESILMMKETSLTSMDNNSSTSRLSSMGAEMGEDVSNVTDGYTRCDVMEAVDSVLIESGSLTSHDRIPDSDAVSFTIAEGSELSDTGNHSNKTDSEQLPDLHSKADGSENGSSDLIDSLDPSHFASSPIAMVTNCTNRPVPAEDSAIASAQDSVSSGTSVKGSVSVDTSTAPSKSGSVDDLDSAPKVVHSENQEQKGHQRSFSLGESRKAKQYPIQKESSASDLGGKSVKTIISNFLSSSGPNPIQNPFALEEHHVLNQVMMSGEAIPIIIYDHEPSSIIAYALCSAEYDRKLQEVRAQLLREDSNNSPYTRRKYESLNMESSDMDTGIWKRNSVLSFLRGSGYDKLPHLGSKKFDIETVKYNPRLDKDAVDEIDEPDYSFFSGDTDKSAPGGSSSTTSKSNKDQSDLSHIELQFSDNTANFYCKVYFAEQFKKLRKLIFPAGEERYIRSLSRCYTWLVKGGKSGSSFCKTQDDRFILKQMSRYEVQSFNKFAPHYFNYMTSAYNEQKPTVLAKILGIYRIGFRDSQTFSENKQDLLVMENLFYDRNITQIFDLKGSLRNRLVTTLGKRVEDLVLLDENLLKLSIESPLYIRPHSKTILSLAVTNDTQFLASLLVMDYSLLVGVDENRQELVLGLIDYIRTFTWDKKLEMVVKTTYSQLGGQGKMPTVVYPESYRGRFIQSMDRYFLPVPDRWAGLGREVDC